jgi:hypothetical protein
MLNVKIVLRTPVNANLRSPLASEEPVTRIPPPVTPTPTGGSTDPRTFLMLHARQQRLQARIRRWKRAGLVLATATAAAVLLTRRPADTGPVGQRASAPPMAMVVNMAPEPVPLPPSLTIPAPTPVRVPAPAPAATVSLEPAPATAATPATSAAPNLLAAVAAEPSSSTAGQRCQETFSQRLWKAAVEHCREAYAAQPDADVAMKIAHAFFARSRVRSAGLWARRAVTGGTQDVDAFVLIGHAERHAGRDRQAERAYRTYLRSSPKGWHARRVRAALRGLRERALSRLTPVYTPYSPPVAASSLTTQLVAR